MTDDERSRLNVALLLLEIVIDISENKENGTNDLAWAAHSYIQSVTLEASLPDEDARTLYAKLQTTQTIIEAKTTIQPRFHGGEA